MLINDELSRRISRQYNIPLQLASFLSLLIVYECVTTRRIYDELGTTECRQLAFRLRKAVPTLTLNSRRFIGYWLSHSQRASIAYAFGVEIEPDTMKVAIHEGTTL